MDVMSEGKSSLLDALKKFVGAVEVMDETVMIPSRLKDMEVSSNRPMISEDNNNVSDTPNIEPGANLYSFYKTLNKLQKEIVKGQSPEADGEIDQDIQDSSSDDGSENSDDSAERTAANFRYHLRGLFSSLNQMTTTANYVTSTYESEVGQSARHAHFSSFAM